jgi:hypothetical protein
VIDSHQYFVRLYESNFPSYISSELDFADLPRAAARRTGKHLAPDRGFFFTKSKFEKFGFVCGLKCGRMPPRRGKETGENPPKY